MLDKVKFAVSAIYFSPQYLEEREKTKERIFADVDNQGKTTTTTTTTAYSFNGDQKTETEKPHKQRRTRNASDQIEQNPDDNRENSPIGAQAIKFINERLNDAHENKDDEKNAD